MIQPARTASARVAGLHLPLALLALACGCGSGASEPRPPTAEAGADSPMAQGGATPAADGARATGGTITTFDAGLGGAPGGGGGAVIDAVVATGGIPGAGGLDDLDASIAGGGASGSGGPAAVDAGIATGGELGSGGNAGGGDIDAGAGGGGGGAGGTSGGGGTTGSGGTLVTSICGDTKVTGNEGCDDGNILPFDGCSTNCRKEPACGPSGPCTSTCGDGFVVGEACDDGNTLDGDGCSADCQVESGWNCAQPGLGDKILVPAVYRDFRYHNPSDFEAGVTGQEDAFTGMVKADLDGEGKPVFTGITGSPVHVESATTFAEWYRDVSGVNHANAGTLALWRNGNGDYVNRYGANGEQWNLTKTAYFCGQPGFEIDGQPCTYKVLLDGGTSYPDTDCLYLETEGYTQLKCYLDTTGKTYQASYLVTKVDGNPLFFPVDGDSFTPTSELAGAQVPSRPLNLYDMTATWPWDYDDAGNKRPHNFSFTSELRYWLKYDAKQPVTVQVNGDDDVWVFIHGKLAIDLGGIHTPVAGSVTLNATAATQLGLADGGVYEIAVFQAERQSTSSSFALTLPGFNTAPSQCTRL